MKTFRNTVLRLALLPVLLFSVSLQEGKAQDGVLEVAGAVVGTVASATGAGDQALEQTVVAGFWETFAHQMENLEQQILAYEEMIRGNDMIRSVYSASKFLTSAPEVAQLYSEIEIYNAMIQMLYNDLKRYASDPDMDPARLAYTARLLNSSEQMVSKTIENTMDLAFMKSGLDFQTRLKLIKDAIAELMAHKGLIAQHIEGLKRFKKQKKMDYAPVAATKTYHQALAPKKPGIAKPRELIDLQLRESGEILTDEQNRIADEILDNAKKYKAKKQNYTVDNFVKEKDNVVKKVINITSLVVGLIAAAMGALAYARRQRGERQVNDAIYKWLIGILFFIFALQIVKILIA